MLCLGDIKTEKQGDILEQTTSEWQLLRQYIFSFVKTENDSFWLENTNNEKLKSGNC